MDTNVNVEAESSKRSVNSSLARITLAAGFGGFVEYFDFFIASFAASGVWEVVFFSGFSNPSVAAALSFASFGVVFLARPVGAFIFGQVADKLGRRNTLLMTMVAMGIGLLGIGLLPPFSQIGVTAIALLFLFRLLFGIGIGGEFGGAVSWITESASSARWRPFWNLWATPVPLGLLAASLTFGYLASVYGPHFVTTGWRIPFIFGAALVVIGLVIRYKVSESPLMRELMEKNAVDRSPAPQTLKLYWKKIIVLALSIAFMITLVSAIEVPFSVKYLATKGLSPVFLTYATSISFAFGIFTLLLGFVLGSRIGRRNMLFIGAFWALLSVIIFFPLVNTLNHSLVIFADMMLFGPTVFTIASQNTLFAESFPTKYRASGSGIAYTIGGLIAGLITVFVLPSIIVFSGGLLNSWPYVAAVGVIIVVGSIVALRFVTETRDLKVE